MIDRGHNNSLSHAGYASCTHPPLRNMQSPSPQRCEKPARCEPFTLSLTKPLPENSCSKLRSHFLCFRLSFADGISLGYKGPRSFGAWEILRRHHLEIPIFEVLKHYYALYKTRPRSSFPEIRPEIALPDGRFLQEPSRGGVASARYPIMRKPIACAGALPISELCQYSCYLSRRLRWLHI